MICGKYDNFNTLISILSNIYELATKIIKDIFHIYKKNSSIYSETIYIFEKKILKAVSIYYRRAVRRKASFARKKTKYGHIFGFFRAILVFLHLALLISWLFFVPRDDI